MDRLEEFEQTIQEIKTLNEKIIEEWKNKYGWGEEVENGR